MIRDNLEHESARSVRVDCAAVNVRFSAPVEGAFPFDDALIHVDAKRHARECTSNKQVAEATPTAGRLLYLSIQG
jgi:hypothetical protein